MLDEKDFKRIEKMIDERSGNNYGPPTFLTILFLLFLQGCFKGCGY